MWPHQLFTKNRGAILHKEEIQKIGDIWSTHEGFISVENAQRYFGLALKEAGKWAELYKIFSNYFFPLLESINLHHLASGK